jgi:hypothetical protein
MYGVIQAYPYSPKHLEKHCQVEHKSIHPSGLIVAAVFSLRIVTYSALHSTKYARYEEISVLSIDVMGQLCVFSFVSMREVF